MVSFLDKLLGDLPRPPVESQLTIDLKKEFTDSTLGFIHVFRDNVLRFTTNQKYTHIYSFFFNISYQNYQLSPQ